MHYVIGDIHGQYDKFVRLLRGVQLVDEDLQWCGGDSTLCLLGDFVDRGAGGIDAIELTMDLQRQAADAGGSVTVVLGNHDVLILAAHFHPDYMSDHGKTFTQQWLDNGGVESELTRLTDAHIAWIERLPAMIHLDNRLVAHADAWFYKEYGSTVDAVNRAILGVMQNRTPHAYDLLLGRFSQRHAFDGDDGIEQARAFLQQFSGDLFLHGHTPIPKMTGQEPDTVTAPYVYAGGLCINLDHGLYLGGEGFVYEF